MKIRLRQIRIVAFLIVLVIITTGTGYWWGTRQGQQKTATCQFSLDKTPPIGKEKINLNLFWEVWDRLYANYLDKTVLDPTAMVYGAIRGMVASLKDPYTVFLPPTDNKQSKEDLNGAFDGVGIQLDYKDEQLVVVAPLAGMPAEMAGVKAGDLILKIDDRETTGMNIYDAVKLIRGPKGTKVRLTLLHTGEKETYEVNLERTTIIVKSVEMEFLAGNLVHLKLTRFGDRTNDEWNQAVAEILNRQPKVTGIIFDLRNNPGGYLDGAVFITSEFIASGIAVQQETVQGNKNPFPVSGKGKLLNQKLAVLVNQGSASASEIVAGALQDYKRATICGAKTFGKGTVQEAQELAGGSGLHVTIARWLLPFGRSIDKNGVTPDIEIKDNPETDKDEQLEKAIEILTND